MSQPFRTTAGGRIRRDRPVSFSFDGREYAGYEGDTLASALLANDVHLLARSFKYHRPRGVLSAGSEEPNALVTTDRGDGRITPNQRATMVELYDGLQAQSQNRWPSLTFDLGAVAGVLSPLLAAGFYYKTFMRPAAFWRRIYEPAIRAAAGMGRAPRDPDPDHYLHRHAHCDVLVIGAGPAGLAAALSASAAGARVMLCDEQAEPGGSLLAETAADVEGEPAARWLSKALATLAANGVTLLPRTTAFGWFPDNLLGLVQRVTDHLADPDPRLPRERLWQVRAREVVIATGAIERPLVFAHNDRPGVMLADSARIYLASYGVKVGSRVVIATAHDSAYRAALELHDSGVQIAAIADARTGADGPWQAMVRALGIKLHTGATVARTSGRMRVSSVRLTNRSAPIACDTLLMCGGWTPTVHLFSQSRGRLAFDPQIGAFVPGRSAANERSAGACAGVFALSACVQSGYAAGQNAVRAAGFGLTGQHARRPDATPAETPGSELPAFPLRRMAFVDFQNDVTTKDLAIATREGFRSIEHVKRYTTTGMATDQGKTSNLNALATVANLLQQPIPAIGHTSFRPPYTPVSFGSFAGAARGKLFEPVRCTPLHAWAEQHGALFEDVGAWRRARCFPRQGEDMRAAVARECRAVRSGAGLLDASTLGKIEVVGPDAGEFLNRMYTGNMATLAPGHCRYGVLLRETGFVFDDGVVARLAHDRYHVTTTTGGAAAVLHHMEDYFQTEFPELRVWLTSITEQWAAIAVQGPHAKSVLAPLIAGVEPDLAPMRVREGSICGVPMRLFTVSFTGEPGFEVNVPADHAEAVWNAIVAAGEAFGITPYGTEAMHVLRAELGYIIAGQETDGTVTPDDLGLGWTIARSKADFVGRRSLSLADMIRPDRKQLVGLLTTGPRTVLEEGAQLVAEPSVTATAHSLGHVTSAYWSETLQRSIALALVESGRARMGETLYVPMPGRSIPVQVHEPKFYTPAPASPEASVPAAATPAVSTIERSGTIRLSVRADVAASATIGAALGVLLGSAPCRATTADDRAALWLGPDEWLLFLPPQDTDWPSRISAALGSTPASIVDVSSRTVSLHVAGPHATDCLNAFCALDLDPRSFPLGMCTRTLFGKAEIVLWRIDAEVFAIEVARSFADYVRECIAEAEMEFR